MTQDHAEVTDRYVRGEIDLQELVDALGYSPPKRTLGQTIGTVVHTFSNKNDAGDRAQLTITLDFRTSSDADIKAWLCSNRVIAFARPLSKLTLAEMKDQDGNTFVASNIGQKIKSRQEQYDAYFNAFTSQGIPASKADELANALIDRPEALSVLDKNEDDDDEV